MLIEGDTINIVVQGGSNLVDNKRNVTVTIAPFKTIDYIVSKGNTLAGTPITIPINAAGISVIRRYPPFLPKLSESGALGPMKRTLELPFEVIQPVIPGEKGEEHQRGE